MQFKEDKLFYFILLNLSSLIFGICCHLSKLLGLMQSQLLTS